MQTEAIGQRFAETNGHIITIFAHAACAFGEVDLGKLAAGCLVELEQFRHAVEPVKRCFARYLPISAHQWKIVFSAANALARLVEPGKALAQLRKHRVFECLENSLLEILLVECFDSDQLELACAQRHGNIAAKLIFKAIFTCAYRAQVGVNQRACKLLILGPAKHRIGIG